MANYKSQYTGEQIDEAVGKALSGGSVEANVELPSTTLLKAGTYRFNDVISLREFEGFGVVSFNFTSNSKEYTGMSGGPSTAYSMGWLRYEYFTHYPASDTAYETPPISSSDSESLWNEGLQEITITQDCEVIEPFGLWFGFSTNYNDIHGLPQIKNLENILIGNHIYRLSEYYTKDEIDEKTYSIIGNWIVHSPTYSISTDRYGINLPILFYYKDSTTTYREVCQKINILSNGTASFIVPYWGQGAWRENEIAFISFDDEGNLSVNTDLGGTITILADTPDKEIKEWVVNNFSKIS